MSLFNEEYFYPEKEKNINDVGDNSKYIIKVFAPNKTSDPIKNHLNKCDEFYRLSICYCYAGHLITEYIYNPKSLFPESMVRTQSIQLERDTFIFPVVFLYRHSIELLLKAILFKLLGNENDCKAFIKKSCIEKNGHSLTKLLFEIKTKLPISPNDTMLWLESFLAELSTKDWMSDSFRYPTPLLKKKIFEQEFHLDWSGLIYKFESAFEVFEKWYLGDFAATISLQDLNSDFLEETDNYYEKAVVGSPCGNKSSFPQYISYLNCASLLRHYMEEHFKNKDVASKLFLPMCYLYFNCTEISLKRIAFDLFKAKWKKHKIKNIWNNIRRYIDLFSKDDDKEYMDTIEDYCYQISNFDSDSSKFRYPTNKNMVYFFQESATYDYHNVGTFMEAINNALDDIYYDIKNKLDEDHNLYCKILTNENVE